MPFSLCIDILQLGLCNNSFCTSIRSLFFSKTWDRFNTWCIVFYFLSGSVSRFESPLNVRHFILSTSAYSSLNVSLANILKLRHYLPSHLSQDTTKRPFRRQAIYAIDRCLSLTVEASHCLVQCWASNSKAEVSEVQLEAPSATFAIAEVSLWLNFLFWSVAD